MITYCGLRHFYIRHYKLLQGAEFQVANRQPDAYYILTHNREIWDFSPELKDYGVFSQGRPRDVLHLDKPVFTFPINLSDFTSCAEDWHKFARQYTEDLEIEYPHAWYLRFKQPAIFEQFIIDFSKKLEQEKEGGIWGSGQSKLVAKLAAHNRAGHNRIIPPGQTKDFLSQIPLQRFPLPESETLEKLGIKTIGELGSIPAVELSNQFGQKTAHFLHKLGGGEDIVPFQPRPIQEYSWTLDLTTLDGFLRPLEPSEFKPYLKQGLEKLASTLKDEHKVAGQIKLEAFLAQECCVERLQTHEASKVTTNKETYFEHKRQLKQATDEPKALLRIVESLLPEGRFAQIRVVLSKLEASSLAQLTMFWEPQDPKSRTFHETASAARTTRDDIQQQELTNYAQIGVELPRRERLLMLWEECFT